jgi:hypothetical protein
MPTNGAEPAEVAVIATPSSIPDAMDSENPSQVAVVAAEQKVAKMAR